MESVLTVKGVLYCLYGRRYWAESLLCEVVSIGKQGKFEKTKRKGEKLWSKEVWENTCFAENASKTGLQAAVTASVRESFADSAA